MHVDGTNAAGSMSNHADVFRKANGGLSHAAFNVGKQIGLAVAGKVDIHLARAEIEIQTSEGNVAKMQVSVSRAHIHFQLQRDVLAEVQTPIVLGTAEVRGVGFLRDVELADASGHAVVNARGVERAIVGEVRVKHVTRAAIDGELSCAHLQPGVRRLCPLQIHSLCGVLRARIVAVAAGKTASVPKEEDQNKDKGEGADGGADGDSRGGVGIAASIGGIPDLTDSDEDKNEGPVGLENRPRIESRTPVMQEKETPDRNEDDREDEAISPGMTVLGHGTPPLPCTTHAEGK